MEKLEYSYQFQQNPIDPNNSKYRSYAYEALKRGFAEKIAELVLDTSRTEIICFSQFHITQWDESPFQSTLRAELTTDWAREYPVIVSSIPNIHTFQNKEIVPPDKLTFRERLKFIFTGKYPKY